jgi:hypothetical protein
MGELEWEFVTIYYGQKAVLRSEIEIFEDQIESYRYNIWILVTVIIKIITIF